MKKMKKMRNASENKNTFREIISTLCVLKFEIKNHGAMKTSKTQYQDSKTSWAQCVELELRWQFCVHGSTCPEIYF